MRSKEGDASSTGSASASTSGAGGDGDDDLGFWVLLSGKEVSRPTHPPPDGKRALVVHIGKLKGAKAKDGTEIPAAIRITTPLGTLLREGLKLQIDSGKAQTGIYNICIPSGCIISEPMTNQFVTQLKKGAVAKLSFNLLQQGAVNVNISLTGFTKAYDSL